MIRRVCRYKVDDETALSEPERDGKVFEVKLSYSGTAYVYARAVGEKTAYATVITVAHGEWAQARKAARTLCTMRLEWPRITGFVSRDFLFAANNLSPRPWGSKCLQKNGASYNPKVDGERVYTLVFRGIIHVFSKAKGYRHVGFRDGQLEFDGHVVIDADIRVSYELVLLEMLTWSDGRAAPRERLQVVP